MNYDEHDPYGVGIARLAQVTSVADLRAALRSANPAFAEGALKRVALLGVGGEGRVFANTCRVAEIEIIGVYDGNARKRGTRFAGMPVYPSDALTALSRDIPVVIASHRVLGAYEALVGEGYIAAPLARLQVAWPERFRPHEFYAGLIEDLFENRLRYAALFGRLSDDLSRRTLNAMIAYRLTLDPVHLRAIIDWDLYGSLGLFGFGADEVYVDGGTYDGDSVAMFSEHVGGKFAKVYGFEPDKDTFRRLEARFGGDARVELHNAGLYSSTGTLGFSADGSRAAKFDPASTFRIDTVKLDDLIPADRVSLIKMNIEGAEIEALKGARALIARCAPRLAISAYHRPSDLWQLADLIADLNGCYRLYLRQHDGGIIETVIYAIAT